MGILRFSMEVSILAWKVGEGSWQIGFGGLSPLQGFGRLLAFYPQLTLWAALLRRFAAECFTAPPDDYASRYRGRSTNGMLMFPNVWWVLASTRVAWKSSV